MLYQSANDNLGYLRVFFTFPGEIICEVGKTGEESGNEAENYSSISASNKQQNIPINFQSCIV